MVFSAPVVCDVGGIVHPDAAVVEALARLQLSARRKGRSIVLCNACGALEELVVLMGLSDVLPRARALAFETKGQPEEREQSRRVEKEGDPADPTG